MLPLNFSEKLYELRKSQKLSQKELAKRIGVSQASINYWEKGQRTPSIDAAYKIADYFEIEISQLLDPDTYDRESTVLLGDNIKSLREEKGYSIKQLSELTQIPQSIIKQYEAGLMTPKNKNILKLASVLDYSGERLLGEDTPFIFCTPSDNIVHESFMFDHVSDDPIIRSSEFEIINNFRELNDLGQSEAQKRVAELTEISRYLKVKKNKK